jgi:uncharacterized protein
VAYDHATGKRTLRDAAVRVADHLAATFGPGKRHWVAGHAVRAMYLYSAMADIVALKGEARYLAALEKL